MGDVDGIAATLRGASEDLADRALSLLREAMRADEDEERARLKSAEKRVTRARRSVEKAIALLEGASGVDTVDE